MDHWRTVKDLLTVDGLCRQRGYEVNRAGFVSCGGESTPSLKVYGDGWYCFRCSEGGDIYDFLAHTEGTMSFDALRLCADVVGVDIDDRKTTIETEKCDLEALDMALRGYGWTDTYKSERFRYRELFELYRFIASFHHITDTENMRQWSCRYGRGWQKRINHKVSAAVDVLLFGVDFYGGEVSIEDLVRKPLFYGALDYPLLEV